MPLVKIPVDREHRVAAGGKRKRVCRDLVPGPARDNGAHLGRIGQGDVNKKDVCPETDVRHDPDGQGAVIIAQAVLRQGGKDGRIGKSFLFRRGRGEKGQQRQKAETEEQTFHGRKDSFGSGSFCSCLRTAGKKHPVTAGRSIPVLP